MTSFDTLEKSAESSRRVSLYRFAIGSTTYLFTSSEEPVTIGTDTYVPEVISHSKIGQGVEERRRTVTITVPGENVFPARFLGIPPGTVATLNIYQIQRDETPSIVPKLLYRGVVQGVGRTEGGMSAEIAVRSIEVSMSRTIPKFSFMAMCNHILYGAGCLVDPTGFNVIGEVLAVSANVITVNGANAQPNGYWTGGYCKPTAASDFRLILAHTGNDLTLLLPFDGTVLGSNVQVFAGCDHRAGGDCATKFDNGDRFGGHPFVPTKNPFDTGLS